MDWITPVSTLIGTMVGVGSTLLGETVRAKRDRGHQRYELRRQLYARYLEALTNTDSELQLLAIRRQTPVDEADLRAAWRSHSLLSLNYEIALVAPPPVADAADTAYRSLRAMRNVLGAAEVTIGSPGAPEDNAPGTAEWRGVHRAYIDAMTALRSAMRADIGNSA
ncbi:hypothetical protein [Streptomyces sp. ME19-01-6]|uniref:hypothetical protein n=1 Tax=Streptomyces sp. ME19-01-6 TaxID=3028686 RepID=UPI0029B3E8CA|nr:hypothetical protein [Streptomyces sp. ME19-01-6]MDX3228314.1 hypothetical protein [Streptomyces sp. ME19-01-6]